MAEQNSKKKKTQIMHSRIVHGIAQQEGAGGLLAVQIAAARAVSALCTSSQGPLVGGGERVGSRPGNQAGKVRKKRKEKEREE